MQRLAAIASSSSSSSSSSTLPLSEDVRTQIIAESRARIEERLKHCNPVIPQHRLTLFCSLWLLRKLDFVSRQQWALLRRKSRSSPHSSEHFATEEYLVEALEILEPRLVSEDDFLKQYAWARKAYPQYHVTMYILWHLCVKPKGPSVDRAWQTVDTLFSTELWNETTSGFGPKSAVLEALRLKAVSLRDKVRHWHPNSTLTWDGGGGNGHGSGHVAVATAAEGMPADLITETGSMGSGNPGVCFDIASDEWPNWVTLAQGFQPEGQGLFPSNYWQ